MHEGTSHDVCREDTLVTRGINHVPRATGLRSVQTGLHSVALYILQGIGRYPSQGVHLYRGTSTIRKSIPPQGHHRVLGIRLLQGPTGALFLMCEVPLYPMCSRFLHANTRRVILNHTQ